MTFGFGIVGCGLIARFHARAIQELPNAMLVAAQSRRPESAASLAATAPGCTPYTDLAEMLRRPDLDIVCICTPSGAHLEPALAAAAAGKHVVVEKPLEVTLERCDRLIDACDRAGVKLCTIFPSRFADANVALRQAVDAGRFGRLTLAETTCKWWRTQQYYDQGGWKGTQALDGGGALMNQAIHNVDLLLWLAGPVAEVAAFTATLAHERIEVEDTAAIALRFKNGALGSILAATSAFPGLAKTIALHGARGSAVVEQEDVLIWSFDPELPADDELRRRFTKKVGASGGASDPAAISHEYHRRQLADFVRALETGAAPRVDGREGRKAVELILAIYESAASGRVVALRS
jgi:UDP-N-acetyl-2-amino-2-deoxyglucuronate dehydrogenase